MKMAADDRDLVIQDYIDKESKFSKDLTGSLAWSYYIHVVLAEAKTPSCRDRTQQQCFKRQT